MYPNGGEEQVLGPYQVGALRIMIAGIVLLPIALVHLKKLTKSNFIFILITGVFGNLFPALLFTMAQTRIDSSMAGILNMGTSFFVTIIGIIIYKAFPSLRQLVGLVLGTAGVIMLLRQNLDFEMGDLNYALLILVATLFYATSLTTIKFKLKDVPAVAITSISFMMILLPATYLVFHFDAFDPVVNHPDGLKSLGFISILAVVGTAIAVMLFTKLIEISNHIFASAVAYMLPIVAIFIGVLDGEKFGWMNYLYVPAIILGVYLMNRSNSKSKKSPSKS